MHLPVLSYVDEAVYLEARSRKRDDSGFEGGPGKTVSSRTMRLAA